MLVESVFVVLVVVCDGGVDYVCVLIENLIDGFVLFILDSLVIGVCL